jgi:hypothetical protein
LQALIVPSRSVNIPALQSEHRVCCRNGLKLPGAQATHDEYPCSLYVPSMHSAGSAERPGHENPPEKRQMWTQLTAKAWRIERPGHATPATDELRAGQWSPGLQKRRTGDQEHICVGNTIKPGSAGNLNRRATGARVACRTVGAARRARGRRAERAACKRETNATTDGIIEQRE